MSFEGPTITALVHRLVVSVDGTAGSGRCGQRPTIAAGVFIWLLVGTFGFHGVAFGRNWEVRPSIELGGTYSDNIALAPPGDEQADFVTAITPGVAANIEGRRLQGDLSFQMQNFFYAENSDANDTFYQYDAKGQAELIKERGFVEAASSLFQRIIISEGRRFFSNRTITDNRTNVLTAAVRPSWRQPLGNTAEGLAQYEYGIVNFGQDVQGVTSDSEVQSFLASIKSAQQAQRFGWLLSYQHQDIDYRDPEFSDLTFARVGPEIQFRATGFLDLIAAGGYENNDFGPLSPGAPVPEGPFWEVGARWQPRLRAELEARFGERFFGNTYTLRWRQRGRHFATQVGLVRDLATNADVFLRGGGLIETPKAYGDTFSLTTEAFVRSAVEAGATLTLPKTDASIRVFGEERKFAFAAPVERERIFGVDSSVTWRFAQRTSAGLTLYWGRQLPRGQSDQEIDYGQFGALIERKLGRRTTLGLQFTRSWQNSDEPSLNFQENALTLNLIWAYQKSADRKEKEREEKKKPN